MYQLTVKKNPNELYKITYKKKGLTPLDLRPGNDSFQVLNLQCQCSGARINVHHGLKGPGGEGGVHTA